TAAVSESAGLAGTAVEGQIEKVAADAGEAVTVRVVAIRLKITAKGSKTFFALRTGVAPQLPGVNTTSTQ
ncbi:hypothetical protein AB0M20_31145, partial [Actinoplanes sp. NPDC051633]|uniref:hypothetical protein n=1 Tax=Actinoplanes sp. NPDC051633 TaxID=3155670 RepID=UPI00343296E6